MTSPMGLTDGVPDEHLKDIQGYACGSCTGTLYVDHEERRGPTGVTGHLHWHSPPCCEGYRSTVQMPAEMPPELLARLRGR